MGSEFLRLWERPYHLIEVAVLSLLLWGMLSIVRGTKGESMLMNMGVFLGVSFIVLRGFAQQYELDRLTLVLDAIFQASIVALVVIFQPELRRGLALNRWLRPPPPEKEEVDEIVNATILLGQAKVGALIALERKDSLKNYLANGTPIDAKVTARLLRQIFWPGTPLHDGAVIIRSNRIAAAECLLPNTDRQDLPRSLGMRHRAALGLSEVEDALVVTVSEETGIISLAERGRIERDLDRERLSQLLHERYLAPTDDEEDATPDSDPDGSGEHPAVKPPSNARITPPRSST